MSGVQRVGDPDTGGGVVTTGNSTVRVNGRPVAVPGALVTWHGKKKHSFAVTTGGVPSVRASGVPLIVDGDKDSCGHTRTSGSSDVRAG